MNRGFFGIGVWHPKREQNIGTLWRSANIMGASFIFTVGRRYKQQNSDTPKTPRHIPLIHYSDIEDLYPHLPHGCRLVGIEILESATALEDFRHPQQVAYILGAEDHGLPGEVLRKCHEIVRLRGDRCLNVAVAGSIVMYDRMNQGGSNA